MKSVREQDISITSEVMVFGAVWWWDVGHTVHTRYTPQVLQEPEHYHSQLIHSSTPLRELRGKEKILRLMCFFWADLEETMQRLGITIKWHFAERVRLLTQFLNMFLFASLLPQFVWYHELRPENIYMKMKCNFKSSLNSNVCLWGCVRFQSGVQPCFLRGWLTEPCLQGWLGSGGERQTPVSWQGHLALG